MNEALPTRKVVPGFSPIDPATAHFVQVPLGVKPGTTFRVGSASFIGGSAGRNILTGPRVASFGSVAPSVTPARVSGVIPENSLDATDPATGKSLFLKPPVHEHQQPTRSRFTSTENSVLTRLPWTRGGLVFHWWAAAAAVSLKP